MVPSPAPVELESGTDQNAVASPAEEKQAGPESTEEEDKNATSSTAEEGQAGPRPGDKVINLCERAQNLSVILDAGPTAFDRQWDRYVQWSPDGSRILFNLPRLERGSLYGVAFDGSSRRAVVEAVPYVANPRLQVPDGILYLYGGSMMYFDISPDSSRIVYSRCAYTREEPGQELSNDWDSYGRYYQVVPGIDDVGNAEQEQEASSWVYNYEIVVSDIDGANEKRLTNNTSWENFPVWSPDGSKIAFLTDTEPFANRADNLTIYTLATGGSVTIALDPETDGVIHFHPLVWSPNGERLAFVAGVWSRASLTGKTIIYTVEADGSELTLVSEAASGPAWSPDGQRIAVVVPVGEAMERPRSTSDGIHHVGVGDVALYTLAADGSDAVLVADSDSLPAPKVEPEDPWMGDLSWSPNGSEILLNSFGYRVPVDGSTPFDGGPSNYFMDAAWSPDGSRIAILVGLPPYYDWYSAPWKPGVYIMDRDGTNIRAL